MNGDADILVHDGGFVYLKLRRYSPHPPNANHPMARRISSDEGNSVWRSPMKE
jgi:hypothetical protein